MKLRWILLPLAVLSVTGVLWIMTHGPELTPEALLESVRAHLAEDPPDRALARRELDEALRLAQSPEQAELRAALLDQRAALYAAEGLAELALTDCKTRMEEWGASTDVLALASELCLELGEPGLALEYAEHLAALDPGRGQSRIGRCRVALADLPLAALARLAESTLLPSVAAEVVTLAQRAAVFVDGKLESTPALEEMLALFGRADERRRASEWVREAAEHLKAARSSFVSSLAPGSTSEAAAGLQDLLLRGGAQREAADLGAVALSIPTLAHPMPVLARTASALVALGREGNARALILDLEKRKKSALDPDDLPSLALRDELQEWCSLLETLGMWEELRAAAKVFCPRALESDDTQKIQQAWLFAAKAELRLGQLPAAQRFLDAIGTGPLGDRVFGLEVWLARAELARRRGERSQERYALLLVTRTAPFDPPPPQRAQVGRAWQRLSELNKDEGNAQASMVSLTHALRCSSERAAELEPLWHELGRKTLATGGTSNPYLLYTRARNQIDGGEVGLALTDARALLKDYPGLGPALELVSRAADKQRDYPQMIGASLDLLERGWPGAGASSRLRAVPKEYFLPQDRVRWMLLDPRGSLEPVLRTLLAKGDLKNAALAVRSGPAKQQPPELLPFLADVALQAGEPVVSLEMLGLLPAGSTYFRSSTGIALNAALRRSTVNSPAELISMVAKVVKSGEAVDPALPAALDALLANRRTQETEALLAWLAPQTPPFLGEVLLRQTLARLLAQPGEETDEDLERAAALLEDGRPELGRMILAFERGDEAELASEARAALETPLAHGPARRAALTLLADLPANAQALLAGATLDGRELLLELDQACVASSAPDLPEEAPGAPLSAALPAAVPAKQLLLFALAAEIEPWNTWALTRIRALEAPVRQEPWLRAFEAQAWLTLGWPSKAQGALGPPPAEGETDARLAWLRARVERARGADAAAVLAAEVAWLEASGRAAESEPELVILAAARAMRTGTREDAVQLLEAALEKLPGDASLRLALAELENVPGRRTRAIELYSLVLATQPGPAGEAQVLPFLEVLRGARDAGEISEERWWAEVEALEAERPEDPAPARELAARAFEQAGQGAAVGRVHALERFARLRARTLDRALDSLRGGEGQRWIELFARYTPERAVALADEELRRDPSDPALWRASATALLAAGRSKPALERLEALEKVAPEPETARLLALTSFQISNDPDLFAQRVAAMKRFDEEVDDDPVLAFYSGLLARGKGKADGLQRSLELWRSRAKNGLAAALHGRTLALGLFYAGRRAPALAALGETRQLASNALEQDVIEAMAYLMRNAPAAPRRIEDAPPPPIPAPPADDAPGAKASGAKASGKGAKAGDAKAPKASDGKTPKAGDGKVPKAGDGKTPKPGAKDKTQVPGAKKAAAKQDGAKKPPK